MRAVAIQQEKQKPRVDYLHDGEYRLSFALKKAESLAEPNRSYAIA